LRFLERLREAPLTNSVQMGRFSQADIARSQATTPGADGKPAVSSAQIQGAFRDSKPEHLLSINQVVVDSLKNVGAIDAFLTSTVGGDKAPNLDLLKTELKDIQKSLIPYLPAGTVEIAPDAVAAGNGSAGAPAGQPISGEIQSRKDAILMLDKICQYYDRTEPASPVPSLLRRAQRLAEMDFLQIIQELCPDAEGTVRSVTGQKPKTE
jgi:type VI secretion system protein ImpA